MNNHKIATVFLALLIGAMGFGVNYLRGKASTASEAAEAAKQAAQSAEQTKKLAQIQLKTLNTTTEKVRTVYNEWVPFFEATSSSREAEQLITGIVKETGIFLVSQRFNYETVSGHELISDVVVAELTVQDSYSRALNWLGKVEESIPTSTVYACHIEPGDTAESVKIYVKLKVPIVKTAIADMSVDLSGYSDDDLNKVKIEMRASEKRSLILKSSERNPYAVTVEAEEEVIEQQINPEDQALQQKLSSLVVTGSSIGPNGLRLLVNDILVEEGAMMPQLIPEQTQTIKVVSVDDNKVIFGWIDKRSGFLTGQTVDLEFDLGAKVNYVLQGQGQDSTGNQNPGQRSERTMGVLRPNRSDQ